MILYPRAFSGMGLLLTCAGSALPRAIVPAIFSTIIALALEIDYEGRSPQSHPLENLFSNPYPYQVFAYMVAFALVFRTNVAYNRYWEGLTNFKTFTAKWGDCATFLLSFDRHTDAKRPIAAETTPLFSSLVAHRFSLLHALSCAHLRREVDLRLAAKATPPSPVHAGWQSDNVQLCSSVPDQAANVIVDALAFRSLGHYLSLLCSCVNFWQSCRHSSTAYREHLERTPLPVLGGLSDSERNYLGRLDSEARVNAMFAMIISMCQSRRAAGGVNVDAPVLSRFHQEMSAGMHGFQQACKLEDTPFPFPYAQVVSLVLFIFALSYPVIAVSKAEGEDGVRAMWLPPLLTFWTVCPPSSCCADVPSPPMPPELPRRVSAHVHRGALVPALTVACPCWPGADLLWLP